MNEFEQNIPDDFWRKAFTEADETPPPRVWDAIERQLDESSQSGIVPLWGIGSAAVRPLIWGTGIAAAVALLLVGWWLMDGQPADRSAAQLHRPASIAHQSPAMGADESTSLTKKSLESRVATATKKAKQLDDQVAVATYRNHPIRINQRKLPETIAFQAAPSNPETIRTGDRENTQAQKATSAYAATSSLQRMSLVSPSAERPVTVERVESVATLSPAFARIAGKSIRLRTPGAIQRIVWVRPTDALENVAYTDQPERTRSKRESRPVWASVSVMPGSYNPAVSVRSAQVASVASFGQNTANSNQASVASRPELSVAYQAGAGVQLTEHWSIESGVGYLAGRSTVESPGQIASGYSAQANMVNQAAGSSNLYVDAVRNSAHTNLMNASMKASADMILANTTYAVQNQYDSHAQQVVTNNYQFVQVPLQAGYQLRPRKRLGLALLGGFLTNIFVRNTVDNLVVTPNDGIYRPLSLAAILGARFRYRPSGRWSASLAGVYQPTLGSATQPDSQVQSHPTSTGMSFGVDYHF